MRQQAEADLSNWNYAQTHLSAQGAQRDPLASLRHHLLLFDGGAKFYGLTHSQLITWNLHQGRELQRVRVNHDQEFFGSGNFVACSADGRTLALFMESFMTSNKYHRLVLIAATGDIEREVMRREDERLSFPDEFVVPTLPDQGRRAWIKRIVTRDGDHQQELNLWNLESGESIAVFSMERRTGFALCSDLSVLAMLARTYDVKGTYELRLIDCVTGEVLRRNAVPLPPAKREDRMPIAISMSANRFAYETDTHVILCAWDNEGQFQERQRWPKTTPVGGLQFSPAGEHLGVYLQDCAVEVHTLPDGPTLTVPVTISASVRYRTACLSPDLKLLILLDDKAVLRYSLSTGKELLRGEAVE